MGQLGLDVDLAGVVHAIEFHPAYELLLVLIDGVDVVVGGLARVRTTVVVVVALTLAAVMAPRRAGRGVAVAGSLTSLAVDAAPAVAPSHTIIVPRNSG